MSIAFWVCLSIILGIGLFVFGFIFTCKGADEELDKWYN
ncbi:hypothetical protein Acj61p141 [Acinetobacter phage Acj61]|uniref:Uncharacterized protein n=1 Tax=Acinetobacter phage Acj61 TaxID=760732 RepID=E5E4C2_9CAUD|nr:hypothetical protein Acj61p141 [Acinetobacter phage Acj61]ADG36106.1 hypothetical protein Acj61p141 [Acinetobacter phage Acj61]